MLLLYASIALATMTDANTMEKTTIKSYPLISHRQQLKRRNLSPTNSALFQGMGTHYVDLYVGSPNGQPQTLIVDTGSQWTAFPCVKDCCGKHTDSEFDQNKSETYRTRSCSEGCGLDCSDEEDTCTLEMWYAEKSGWSALEAVDRVSLSNRQEDSFELRFGCQTKTTNMFLTQLADGIMGMDDDKFSLWRQAGVDSFSLCFSSSYKLEDSAGVMTLGGFDHRLFPEEPMKWAKRLVGGDEPFYIVEMTNMYFKTDDVDLIPVKGFDKGSVNSEGVLLDSGTTDTYFPVSQGSAYVNAFQQSTGLTWSNKLQLSLDQVKELPTLVIELEGLANDKISVEVPPLHYFEPNERQDGQFVPALFFQGSQTVLGANFFQGHNVHFAKDRIGFAKSSCSYEDVAKKLTTDEEQSHSVKQEVQGGGQKDTRNGGNAHIFLILSIVGVSAIALAKKRAQSNKQAAIQREAARVEIQLT